MPEFRRHLDVQQLDASASAIRVTLQKARAAVLALPDVRRSVDQQRAELAALEARVARMTGMMRALRATVEADVAADRLLGEQRPTAGA